MLNVGDVPADFTLSDDRGNEVRWSALRGSPVAIFAYPKANTPGCTMEACSFRDLNNEFGFMGVRVFGLSADSVKAQGNFRDKHQLNMSLLSDPDHIVLEPWGIWAEKKNYGRTYMGIVRSTFLFDSDGAVVHVWPSVKVAGHVTAVLSKARERFMS